MSREKRARKLESTPKYTEREREQEKTEVKRRISSEEQREKDIQRRA